MGNQEDNKNWQLLSPNKYKKYIIAQRSSTNLKDVITNQLVKSQSDIWLIDGLTLLWQDGDKFWRMPECYIRGSTIKYLRIPDEIIDMVKEEVVSKGRGRGGTQQNKQQGKGRGGAGRGERRHSADWTICSGLCLYLTIITWISACLIVVVTKLCRCNLAHS